MSGTDGIDQTPSAAATGGGRRLLTFLPLVLFAGLAAFFLWRLESGADPNRLPSMLIGRPAPATNLPALPGATFDGAPVPGLASADFLAPGEGRVTIVNYWASWCVECRVEHPTLVQLTDDPRVRLVGIAYKDKPEAAKGFLAEHGNPYRAIGLDENGRAGIDWGVYGVPETYVVAPDGSVTYKHIGPLSAAVVRTTLAAEIDKALARRPARP
jgi:cytochrome c biogenesis protein CcmG/thiol:disulfide interchange protein DsbE